MAAVCCASTSRRAIVARRLDMRTRFSLASARRADAAGCGGCGPGRRVPVRLPVRGAGARRRRLRHVLLGHAAAGAGDGARGRRRVRCATVRGGRRRPSCRGGRRPLARRALVPAAPARRPERPRRCAAASSSTASTSPTFTSSPSWRLMLVEHAGALGARPRGRSSRSRARRAARRPRRASPSFFSQRATRASTTDSPSCGTTMFGHDISLR